VKQLNSTEFSRVIICSDCSSDKMVGENLLDTERVKWGLVLVDGYAAAAAAADAAASSML